MPNELGWGLVLVPAALAIGCIAAVGVWYRYSDGTASGILGRVVVAGLSGAAGYGLLILAWFRTQEPVWHASSSKTDWAIYALLLYFGLSIGLGTGRDGWPLAVGYLLVLGAVLKSGGQGALPYLSLCVGFLGLGFLIEEYLL